MTLREKLNQDIEQCRRAQAHFVGQAEQARVMAILNDGAATQLAQTRDSLPAGTLDAELAEDAPVSEQEAAEYEALGDLELRPPFSAETVNQTMREIEQARGE